MGRASNGKADRRRQIVSVQRDLRLDRAGEPTRQERRVAFLLEQGERPEIVALEAARRADEGLKRQHYADAPGQERRLRKAGWACASPGEPGLGAWAHPGMRLQMIHSLFREEDGGLWSHASFKVHRASWLPTWEQLHAAHLLLYPDLFGVQVLAPAASHVNISEVLHVWTRLDAPAVPNFGRLGTI